jgi:hypothetical protein
MRQLWKAAGADATIMQRCTYSDHVKYAALGGIVVATGLMAALAGGYAFYTVFQPKGNAMEDSFDLTTLLMSAGFGFFWGLMIFNLDRFIVASTGKGDGTERITGQELMGALPRIFMGMIIAISISKPMEIRIFKTEIDIALHERQIEQAEDYKKKTEALYTGQIAEAEGQIATLKKEIDEKIAKRDEVANKLEEETAGRAGSGISGMGPTSRMIAQNLDRQENELKALRERNEPEINRLQKKVNNTRADMEDKLAQNVKVASGLDGLLERIKLSHEISGTTISLFITLLFMSIELTPIFFKLMLIKSPYDYLSDNVHNMIKAEQGIEIKYDYYQDKEGRQRDKIVFHNTDLILEERKKLAQAQRELSDLILEQWKAKEKAKIEEKPDDYVNF